MFEDVWVAQHLRGPVAHPDALDASAIKAVQNDLVSRLGSDDLDAHACMESIRALEELACTITAAQAQLAVHLDTSIRESAAGRGVPAAQQGRGVAAQVAFARRVSPHRGQQLLGLAKVVATELPHTWTAWRTGRITEWKATLLARETACLSLADRLAIDAEVAGDAARLEAMGPRELAATAARLAAELDPAAVVAKRRKAESDRHVSLRPAPDTMTWFSALLPVKDGVAVLAALRHAADTHVGAGDPRSRGQIMADTLTARITGHEPATGLPVTLNLTMSDTSLFGTSEDAGHLDGFGPIPAELAREMIAATMTTHDQIAIRRLFTHPVTGQLQAMEARTRLFRGNLARFIRLRDRTCRTPWCEAPIRHTDHADNHAEGGPTTAENGQGLCEACNQAKNTIGWHARPGPNGITTTMPTGIAYRTAPPVLATITRRPITIDYILAGQPTDGSSAVSGRGLLRARLAKQYVRTQTF